MDSLVLVTPPASEPVSLYMLKLQCGLSPVEDTDHVKSQMLSQLLRRYITTARIECENRTRRVLLTQTWTMNLDGFPGVDMRYSDPWQRHAILLPKQPFQSIVSVDYIDVNGVQQALAQDSSYGNGIHGQYAYQLDPGGETQPARIAPAWLVPWPLTRRVQAAVQITFVAGYGSAGASMPDPIISAILFLAHSYYDPTAYKDVDGLVSGLLGPYINRVS